MGATFLLFKYIIIMSYQFKKEEKWADGEFAG